MDRFDLEQEIMHCWNVVDDIKLVGEVLGECTMNSAEQDKVMNMLIGLEALYAARFDKMFRIFEELIRA
jgi:hypothetical protein